ncbi:branched-chain amino acid ABC transporter permease [Gemmobacter fulvus]|uniref:branched-chain amino acid ABC transporter permease n=1 Tax=Gemmobacter fulvus TaxID=2840474 RepID=UPI003520CC76
MKSDRTKVYALHLFVIAGLFALQFVLPPYHHNSVARIMVLATYAMGFNLLFGYVGLMSLGHAMFFAAGMYASGLAVFYLGVAPIPAFGIGIVASVALALFVGFAALRTSGMSFLIVTLMLAQAFWLSVLYFREITGGDYGLVIFNKVAPLTIGSFEISLSDPNARYNIGLLVFSTALLGCLAIVRSPIGRILIAIRENEDRTVMMGYHTFRYKLIALILSGSISGVAGSSYALLFGNIGSSFIDINQSINAILWTLLGGAGTILGPLVGSAAMFYLIDFSSGLTRSFMFIVGFVLLAIVLGAGKGVLGTIKSRWAKWIP